MFKHKCAAWLLLIMLTSMLSLRTTVLGYCLCTDTLLLSGACCCEHQAGPDSVDDRGPTNCDLSHGDACSKDCGNIESCPGDLYVSFEHDDFLAPSLRALDSATTGPLLDDLPSPPALWHLQAADHPVIAESFPAPAPPSLSGAPPRDQLQSWSI